MQRRIDAFNAVAQISCIGSHVALPLELAQRRGWYFVDVASVMYTEDGNSLIPEYCSDPDDMGLHFTEAGCEAWVDYLYTHTVG